MTTYQIRNLNTIADSGGTIITFNPANHLVFLPQGTYKVEAVGEVYINSASADRQCYTRLRFENTTGTFASLSSSIISQGGYSGPGPNQNIQMTIKPTINGVIKVPDLGGQFFELSQTYGQIGSGSFRSYNEGYASSTLFIRKLK
jgi:hypothetical protein